MRSRTAEVAAIQRAVHLARDARPPIFVDDEVLALLSPAVRLWLRLPAAGWRPPYLFRDRAQNAEARMRAQIVVRARYAEDRLERALAQGVTQYLILAAGLDTFALRRRELGRRLRVFEIDRPDTQRWKRDRLRGRIPSHLRFVAVDFEQEGVAEALRRSTFDPRHPAFVSWLGTTYYLSREAILGTLASLRSVLAPGSELVLDYWSKDCGPHREDRWLLAGVRLAVAMQREAMKSFFTPRQIEREIAALGLEILQNASPDAQRQLYLAGRTDGLDVPDFAHLLHLRFP